MKAPKPFLRGEHYYIRCRVPAWYATIDHRGFIHICLFTDSPAIAKNRATLIWVAMVEAWGAKLEGNDDSGERRMEAVRKLAQRRGYRYLDTAAVAKLPLEKTAGSDRVRCQ